jgi:hypothetical protein
MAENTRALNDYTADKVTQPSTTEKYEQPRKVAMNISSCAPGWELDKTHVENKIE